MPRSPTTHEVYAENLKDGPGMAVYRPVQLRTHSGRVCDIGFFHNDGRYEWVRNAFYSEVRHGLHALTTGSVRVGLAGTGVFRDRYRDSRDTASFQNCGRRPGPVGSSRNWRRRQYQLLDAWVRQLGNLTVVGVVLFRQLLLVEGDKHV
jgi:hypothetical protein